MDNGLDNIELRSEEVQEILTKVPVWMIRWGSLLFFAIIVLMLTISWFVKYPDIVSSRATITTQMPPQKEYARITGKIDTILIYDKQKVVSGQPLAILENTADYNDVFYLKSMLDTLKSRKNEFYFPLESLPVLFLGDIDSDFMIFENAYLQYHLNRELKPLTNEANANAYNVNELKNRLANLKIQKDLNASELEFKRKDMKRNEMLYERGVISETEFEAKQLEYLKAERSFKEMGVSISRLREAINNASKEVKGTSIKSAKEEMVLLKNVLQSLNQLKKSIKDWELKYLLKSNIDGDVSFINFWHKNQTVNLGDLVFTIIPTENSTYLAKLKTPPLNSGKIKTGQTVQINLENYPEAEYGFLEGKVSNVSLIPDNEGFYAIDVELPKKLITSYNKEIEFKQEMIGVAKIITEDLRLLERFFYSFKEAFKR